MGRRYRWLKIVKTDINEPFKRALFRNFKPQNELEWRNYPRGGSFKLIIFFYKKFSQTTSCYQLFSFISSSLRKNKSAYLRLKNDAIIITQLNTVSGLKFELKTSTWSLSTFDLSHLTAKYHAFHGNISKHVFYY